MNEKFKNELSGSCDTGFCSCGCGSLKGSALRGFLFVALIAGIATLFSTFSNYGEEENASAPAAEGVSERQSAQAGSSRRAEVEKSEPVVVEIESASDFESRLTRADKPVLVAFSADWCPACRTYDPLFEKAAAALSDKALFFKVDVNKARSLAAKYKIQYLPTTVLLRNGKESSRFSGAKGVDAIKSLF